MAIHPEILTLFEFIGCCFEKNEMLFPSQLSRWNVYTTAELAMAQVIRLAEQASSLLGPPNVSKEEEGTHTVEWRNNLRIVSKGQAVLMCVRVRYKEAYCVHDKHPEALWQQAEDDLTAVWKAAEGTQR